MDNRGEIKERESQVWINPTGGMGDVLMLSGVLKQCLDKTPGIRYKLVRRSIYASILQGHPAISQISYPPEGAEVITTDYWAREKLGKGKGRAYQILARMFGLEYPVKETLYLPGKIPEDHEIHRILPNSGKTKIAIAPVSSSPRKMIPREIWIDLVGKLRNKDMEVLQLGGPGDMYIPGAFSLLGLTTPQQLIGILKSCKLLIGVDNFLMHSAQLVSTKSLIIWGPTDPDVYGYPDDFHLINSTEHCPFRDQCLGPDTPENYAKPCPLNEKHCMKQGSSEELYEAAMELVV